MISKARGILPKRLNLILVVVVAYAILVSPYVFSSAFQSTAQSRSTVQVSAAQLPSVTALYLDSGKQYYLSIVKPLSGNQTWAVVYTQALSPRSLVYVGSVLASWNVQPYSLSVNGYSGFSELIVAGSVTFVPQGTADSEFWLLSGGKGLLDLSTLVALANPVIFIAIAWFFARRLPLWLLVTVAWVYVVQFLAIDVVGSGYGLYPSFTLLAAAVVLIPAAYIAEMLEVSIRERLAKPQSASAS